MIASAVNKFRSGQSADDTGLGTICWTKVHVETGQLLADILHRKNLERMTSGGYFFWGVGNAPNRVLPALLARESSLRLIFSQMKSTPKKSDSQIEGMMMWNTYFDRFGRERDLPEWAFITSRIKPTRFPRHYALVCYSKNELFVSKKVPFDHLAYKNAGSLGLGIAPSQVTALAEKVKEESLNAAYSADMEADLVGDFWVKLGGPVVFEADRQNEIYAAASGLGPRPDAWLSFVRELRQGAKSSYLGLQQGELRF